MGRSEVVVLRKESPISAVKLIVNLSLNNNEAVELIINCDGHIHINTPILGNFNIYPEKTALVECCKKVIDMLS